MQLINSAYHGLVIVLGSDLVGWGLNKATKFPILKMDLTWNDQLLGSFPIMCGMVLRAILVKWGIPKNLM